VVKGPVRDIRQLMPWQAQITPGSPGRDCSEVLRGNAFINAGFCVCNVDMRSFDGNDYG